MSSIPKPTLRIRWSTESQWRCDHCGVEYTGKPEPQLRLASEVEHPDIFDRCIDLCRGCAATVGAKLTQIAKLPESDYKLGPLGNEAVQAFAEGGASGGT